MKTNADCQFEWSDISQQISHLAVRRLRVGQKRTVRDRRASPETVGELTPNDMYHGRQCVILSRREEIKRLTLERREEENLHSAA